MFRLDLNTWRISRVDVKGTGPGWIYEHRASVEGPRQIAVRGGSVLVERNGKESLEQNASVHVLDLERKRWTSKVSDD